jgi:ABC-type transporter Mla MlaB component
MAKKGSKSLRGQAETKWGETKSAQIKAQVTPTGKRLFLEKIRSIGMSLAEFIERVARGKIKLVIIPDSLKELIDTYELAKLVEDADIPIEKLEEIHAGRIPAPDEKLGLCRALDLTPEQLEEAINQQHQERHSNGCNC